MAAAGPEDGGAGVADSRRAQAAGLGGSAWTAPAQRLSMETDKAVVAMKLFKQDPAFKKAY
jgi:hypothetical protein